MDRLLLDSSENSDLKEKLDQAKEQIKQLIKQGSDLREKNERLESQQRLEARNKRERSWLWWSLQFAGHFLHKR